MPDESGLLRHRVAAPAPRRLDGVLGELAPRVSRRELRAAVAAGTVRVNGRRARKGDIVRDGDVVSLPQSLVTAALVPEPDLPVGVLHVDADLIAVDKPAGMPAVAQRSTDVATLANFLVARFPETAEIGDHPFECGTAHRLDTDTSGALLVARNRETYELLRRAFRQRRVEKIYLAVVRGAMNEARTLTAPLRAAGARGARTAIAVAAGRGAASASTEVWPERHLRGSTLVRIRIGTGVRHQIRTHLASIDHPVHGDRLYGGAAADRLLLHAASLDLAHPRGGNSLRVEAPLPEDFRAALARLA